MVPWQKESGDVMADAAYIVMLPTKRAQRRELTRLGRVHGEGHRLTVKRAIKEGWPAMEAKLAPLPIEQHEDPRRAALAAVGGKGGV